MYGTVGRAHVRPENRDRLAEVMMNPAYAEVPGYRRGYLMFPENRDNEVLIVAVFEDRDAYVRNADDPAQHQRYLEYRPCSKTNPSGPTASGWRRRRGAGSQERTVLRPTRLMWPIGPSASATARSSKRSPRLGTNVLGHRPAESPAV